MAGAGFKTFNTGDVLTASDVNTYLMQQTVMVFASAAARTTALGANVAEGMLSYLKDTDVVEVYNGSAWVSSDDPNAIQNTIVDAKGDIITATANDTPARLAVGSNGYTLVADSSAATGLAYGSSALVNPVINGGMDIWQRGTSVTVSGSAAYTYTADRWWIFRTGFATGCSVSRQATGDTTNLPNIQYCARYQRTSGNTSTGIMYFGTDFETVNSIPFAGRTVTLSFYIRIGANYSGGTSFSMSLNSGTGTDQILLNGYTNQTVVATATPTLTTTWQRVSVSGTIASNATQLGVGLGWTPTGTAGANDYIEITGIQIDLGSTALPFRRSGGTIQGELAACQRYYYRTGTPGTASVYEPLGYGSFSGSTSFAGQVEFPVTMRTNTGSVEYSNVAINDTASVIAVTAVTVNAGGLKSSNLNLTVASGGTQYRFGRIVNNNNAAGYLAWSAEL